MPRAERRRPASTRRSSKSLGATFTDTGNSHDSKRRRQVAACCAASLEDEVGDRLVEQRRVVDLGQEQPGGEQAARVPPAQQRLDRTEVASLQVDDRLVEQARARRARSASRSSTLDVGERWRPCADLRFVRPQLGSRRIGTSAAALEPRDLSPCDRCTSGQWLEPSRSARRLAMAGRSFWEISGTSDMQPGELPLADDLDAHRGLGHHGGGPGPVVEQGDLADVGAGAAGGDDRRSPCGPRPRPRAR